MYGERELSSPELKYSKKLTTQTLKLVSYRALFDIRKE
jgi:hypothetical protein